MTGTQVRDAARTLVYVASARSNQIAAFVLHPEDGQLELVQELAVAGSVTPLTVDPARRSLYAGLRAQEASAASFRIDPVTGLLQLIATAILKDPPVYLATDARGKYLLSASYTGATFAINPIHDDGRIEGVPAHLGSTPPHAHCILTDPTNRYLFVTSLGGDVILQYLFDESTGRVIPNAVPFAATPRGCGPRHMVFHPKDDVLYANGELDGSISVYALSRDTGQLRAVRHASMMSSSVVPWAAELAITPDGHYLYASERRSSTLAIFDLLDDPDALRCRDVLTTEQQPRSFAIDPQGRWLIAAGELSDHLTVYRIDPETGGLDAQSGYQVGEKPTWVKIVELGADLA